MNGKQAATLFMRPAWLRLIILSPLPPSAFPKPPRSNPLAFLNPPFPGMLPPGLWLQLVLLLTCWQNGTQLRISLELGIKVIGLRGCWGPWEGNGVS